MNNESQKCNSQNNCDNVNCRAGDAELQLSRQKRVTAIQVAAAWWVRAFANPIFMHGGNAIESELAQRLVKEISVDTQRKFYFALIAAMQSKIFSEKLSVDFFPCARLRGAMLEASVPASNAPWKTITFITENSVLVRSGYGAAEKEIYNVDEIDHELQLLIAFFTERE